MNSWDWDNQAGKPQWKPQPKGKPAKDDGKIKPQPKKDGGKK